ncbi:MAG: hypothetical protein RQ842_02950 [Vulcanisaeta sp.]|nr:hypothetical protein [Vulcanisaeta sp.]
MAPTSRMGRVQIIIRVESNGNGIVIKSGGSTYQVIGNDVLIIPRAYKELYGMWNSKIKKYVVMTSYGDVLHVSDDVLPSELPLVFKYKNATKFIQVLMDILKMYYRGQPVLQLNTSDRRVMKLAIYLARMSQLQSIADV